MMLRIGELTDRRGANGGPAAAAFPLALYVTLRG
jgi:hypothetical protein